MFKLILALFMSVSGGTLIVGKRLGYDPSAIDRVSCEAGQTVCDNLKQCVSKDLFCNGFPDCDDGSDEKRPHCFYRFFSCERYPRHRIRSYLRCDGEVDCPDGSDEDGCLTKPPKEPSTTTSLPAKIFIDSARITTIANNITVFYGPTTSEKERENSWIETTTSTESVLIIKKTTNIELNTDTSTESFETTFTVTTHMGESTLEHQDDAHPILPDQVIKSKEMQGGLISGFNRWITITIAFFAGLLMLLAVVAHLYTWIWKKSSAKQSSAQPPNATEINNDDLFRTQSFSSVGSTNRSLKSSDFYFINPSIVVVDSYH